MGCTNILNLMLNFDLLGLGPYLFIACWCLFIFGIMAIIFASTGRDVLLTGKRLKNDCYYSQECPGKRAYDSKYSLAKIISKYV